MGVAGAVRNVGKTVNRAASATTAAAGALGGAAVNGVVGGVTGAVEGARRGINSGSPSAPAAALALGALGVAGLVEWPVLLVVGGGALLVQKLNRKPAATAPAPKTALKPGPADPAPTKAPPRKAARKTTRSRADTKKSRNTN
jgi:hypothetical protein